MKILQDYRKGLIMYNNAPRLNFENSKNMDDDDYITWTGWTKDQFDVMSQHLGGINSSVNRSKREALGIFWLKLKTDLSFAQIASLLGIQDPMNVGRRKVSETFKSVGRVLDLNFVPKHFGFDHMTPEEAKAHHTVYSKTFFGDAPPQPYGMGHICIFISHLIIEWPARPSRCTNIDP